ncbi:MAG: hypothetical protein ACYC4P_15360 [Thermoanaerobaculia bacterium]
MLRPLRALLLLPMVLGACERDTQRFEKRALLPLGHIDFPASSRVHLGVDEPLRISGWTASDDGIAEVNVYVDRRLVRSLGQLRDRPDVGQALPGVRGSARSGIETAIEPGELGAGTHDVVVQVRTNAGAVLQLCRVEIVREGA